MPKLIVRTRKQPSTNQATDPVFKQLHPVVQRVLSNRNIFRQQDIDHRLKHLLPPNGLKDIDRAASRLRQAIEAKQSILIVGDYDADGATSCALAIKGLRMMGSVNPNYCVPNRFEYGYGLSLKLAKEISVKPPDLVITVDNGISSLQGITHLNSFNVDVIVTDHHLAGEQLPDAYAIVNPNQPDCKFKSKVTAGVGVMFYLLLATHSQLKAQDYFNKNQLAPDLLSLLDLVALGTVSDVVPLDKNNRIMVAQGVARMRAGHACAGIQALMQVAKRDISSLVSQDLGFIVGPRLNAAGRLDDIACGIECLLADNLSTALVFAEQLDSINHKRKNVEQSMQTQAFAAIGKLNLSKHPSSGLVLFDSSWHEGVVGLVASRVKDKTGVPTLVFAAGESGLLKGSARSIPEVHIRDVLALIDAQHPKLIDRFGGHAMAAGLSLAPENLEKFQHAFEKITAEALRLHPPDHTLLTDGSLIKDELNADFAHIIKTLIPWGQTCPEPLFEGVFDVMSSRFVGEIHLKMVLRSAENTTPIDAIFFRYLDNSDSPDKRPALELNKIFTVYQLDINRYRGQETLQLILRHLEPYEK